MNQAELSMMRGMVDILNRHLKEPFLTEEQYNMRLSDLKEFEEETGFVFSNSPTCRDYTVSLVEIANVPKCNYEKCHDINDIIKFANNSEMLVCLNLVGTRASIIYMNGVMKKFVIDNAITVIDLGKISSVPYKINNEDTVYIVNGVLHDLNFYVTDVIKDNKNLYNAFKKSEELGFAVVPNWLATNLDPKNLESNFDYVFNYANEEEFKHDGIVIRFNDISYSEDWIIYEMLK